MHFNVHRILLAIRFADDENNKRGSAIYPTSPLQTKILDVFVGKKQALTTEKKDKMESTVFNGNKKKDKNPNGRHVCRAETVKSYVGINFCSFIPAVFAC